MWPYTLSGRLPVDALVGHYPTNKLIGRELIPHRKNFPPHHPKCGPIRYYTQFPRLIPKCRADHPRVTHPFATRVPKQAWAFPFDLHVLSTPPAFILSQDQTLHKKRFRKKQAVKSPIPNQKQTNQHPNRRRTGKNPKITRFNNRPQPDGAKQGRSKYVKHVQPHPTHTMNQKR